MSFGRSSEKLTSQITQLELLLEDLEEGEAERVAPVTVSASGERERCLEAGMDDYLSKPFSRSALKDLLGRWLTAGAPQR